MSNNSKTALDLLTNYNYSDSSDEDVVPGPRVSVKRCYKDEDDSDNDCLQIKHDHVKTIVGTTKRLPVPSILRKEPEEIDSEKLKEEMEKHGGRIRSFPHERGNWSTYVYIPFNCVNGIEDLIDEILKRCSNFVLLQSNNSFHISLTKTVIIRHHWIESFTKTLSENIRYLHPFVTIFGNFKVYCNEERTRTFLGWEISTGYDSLLKLVTVLNKCLRDFNLPEFYEDPSFHMSLAYCVGDYENVLSNVLDDLNKIVKEYTENKTMYIHVDHLMCKTGNKYFKFCLNGP